MANQSPDRRVVLEMLAKVSIASQFPGFARWSFAGEHKHETAGAAAPQRVESYKPQFFSPHEYETIDMLSELIIPKDESPGAHDAGVSEFIDFMAAHGEPDLKPLRAGLSWLDEASHKAQGKPFLSLTQQEQTALLEPLAYVKTSRTADPQGKAFFALIRRYTVMGYYTSRAGLQELDYPALRFYKESPSCPHTDDPEHRHLPPARF
jgi:gluconate 2-dehydrogenase gamma chain